MKKILIGIAVFIGISIFALFIVSTLFPQHMADFFMGLSAVQFEVEYEGVTHEIKLDKMGEGVTRSDRLYVMKKMVALTVYSDADPSVDYIDNQFREKLIAAAEDRTLSATELADMRALGSDVLTDEMVDNWINLAKKLQEDKQRQRLQDEAVQ